MRLKLLTRNTVKSRTNALCRWRGLSWKNSMIHPHLWLFLPICFHLCPPVIKQSEYYYRRNRFKKFCIMLLLLGYAENERGCKMWNIFVGRFHWMNFREGLIIPSRHLFFQFWLVILSAVITYSFSIESLFHYYTRESWNISNRLYYILQKSTNAYLCMISTEAVKIATHSSLPVIWIFFLQISVAAWRISNCSLKHYANEI